MKRFTAIVFVFLVSSAASAATRTWSGAGNGNWTNAANWDVLPVSGDALVFPAGALNTANTNDFPNGTSFSSITYQGDYLVSGNSFTLGSGGMNITASGSVNMPMAFATAGTQTWTIDGALDVGNTVSLGTTALTMTGGGSANLNMLSGTTASVTTSGSLDVILFGGASYTGPTTVGGSSSVQLALNLGGSLSVLSGGTVRLPTGVFVQGDSSMASGATYQAALNGTNFGEFSRLSVVGNVTIGGALQLTSTISPSAGTQFVIIENGSNNPTTGTFTGLPEGSAIFANGRNYTISYVGNDGNDVVLTTGAPPILIGTSTSLVANPDSVNYGQNVPLTATVTPATADGTVEFREGTTVLGSATLSGGTAQLTLSSLPVGFHTLRAFYLGSSSHQASSSPGTGVQIFQSPVTVAIDAAPNPSQFGQSVDFTITVAPPSGSNPSILPSGNITVFDGPTALATIPLDGVNGIATYSTPSLTVGNHTMSVSYAGDTRYNSGSSGPFTQIVAPAATTLMLSSTPNPSNVGQSVTFTALLFGTPSASGSVTFKEGTTTLAVAAINSGQAQFTTSVLSLGVHDITAEYPGDVSHTASTSPVFNQYVATPTNTTLMSSINPANAGDSITFTATVTPADSSGNVSFRDGGVEFVNVALSGGTATTITSALAAGSHTITAVYQGDLLHNTSTSAPVTQQINAGALATTTTLSSSPNPSNFNQSVTFTATVTPINATGTVTFLDGNTTLGTGTLTSGEATFTTSALTAGSHTIMARYDGDATHVTSASQPLTQQVSSTPLIATTTTLASSNNPSMQGQFVTLTATVTPAGATGTVTFVDGIFVLGTVALSGGTATIITPSLSVGMHFITATYSGDTTHASSASTPLTQVVNAPSLTPTTTTLTIAPNPAIAGTNVTLTATVSPVGANGTVEFYDNMTFLGTASVGPGGQASLTIIATPGTHGITAGYNGNSTFADSQAEPVELTVVSGAATTADIPTLDARALALLALALGAASIWMLKR